MTVDRGLGYAFSLLLLLMCHFCRAQQQAPLPAVNLGATTFLDGIAYPGYVVELIGQGEHDNKTLSNIGQPVPGITDVNSGASLGQALRSLADRSGVADIKPLAATLIQSEQLGAAIGPSERDKGAVMVSQRRMRAKTSRKSLIARLTMRTRDNGGCAGWGGCAGASG